MSARRVLVAKFASELSIRRRAEAEWSPRERETVSEVAAIRRRVDELRSRDPAALTDAECWTVEALDEAEREDRLAAERNAQRQARPDIGTRGRAVAAQSHRTARNMKRLEALPVERRQAALNDNPILRAKWQQHLARQRKGAGHDFE